MLPTLRIIVYTDCQSMFNENPTSPKGSLSDFKAFTKYKIEDLVDVKFCFVNRHPADPQTGREIHAGQKVTCDLLKDADEFWVFGRRKINNEKQRENELDQAELKVLNNWMTTKKGGLFVTGDHSERDETLGPGSCESDHKTFLSLGRALGGRIPRAHQLRDWEGPPTNCNDTSIPLPDRDNFNTQEGPMPSTLDDPTLEYDKTPQKICLTLKDGQPHRLFWYFDPDGTFRPIDKLPDHPHEGVTLAPDKFEGDEWPPKSLPPEIVARGRDKRFPDENRVGGLVTAFDGDSAGIGRIVVDSSFHHYLNYNLTGIPERDVHSKLPLPKTELDQIAQFFSNLALWLAPKPIRDKIKLDLLLSLARDPNVLETRGHSLTTIGQVSRVVLKATIKEARLNWLFAPSQFETWDDVDEFYRAIFLNENPTEPITHDFLLGAVISACQAHLSSQGVADVTRFTDSARVGEVLPQTVMALLNRNETDTKRFLEELTTSLSNELPQLTVNLPDSIIDSARVTNSNAKEIKNMAHRCQDKWNSWINPSEIPPTENPNDGLIVIGGGADFTGSHTIGGTTHTKLKGKCKDNPRHHIKFESEEDGVIFTYEGVIVDIPDKTVLGKRSKRTKESRDKEARDDEVWVGVKTSTAVEETEEKK